jgi:hypothetical protein
MPISTNPNATEPFWLRSDTDTPIAVRPVFLVRFMTTKQIEDHEAILQQAVAEPDNARAANLLMQAVRIGIAGWRNFPVPFSDQAFFDLLTDRERWEVAWHYPLVVKLTPVDMGNSASPAGSARSAPANPPSAEPALAASQPTSR